VSTNRPKKPAEAKPVEAKKDETKKTDKPDEANNKKSGNGAGSAAEKITITFENTMDDQAVSLRIYDEAGTQPLSYTDVSSIAPATFSGKPSGLKNTFDHTVTKDKSGKFDIRVSLDCGRGGGTGGVEYKGLVSKIQIVKGCQLKM
jgi:hypothetical protein